jgi:membrane protein YqaA with SNARE-associated domain
MSLKLSVEPSGDFVEYNKHNKRFQGLVLFSIIALIVISVGVYFGFLRDLGLFQDTFIGDLFSHFFSEIKNFTFLGFFYIYFFGGLILLFIPADPYFFAAFAMGKFHYYDLFAIFAGLLLSYTVNYLIGLRFSRIAAVIVSPKSFYKSKTLVNKWGKWAVLLTNLFSFGSQQVSCVLGVFRYSLFGMLLLTFVGQAVKFVFLLLFLSGIINLF